MNMDSLVAEFLAKGGKVTQVASGERTSTECELYGATRGETFAQADKRTGHTLSDLALLTLVERDGCEK
jgi:hypothetical protein